MRLLEEPPFRFLPHLPPHRFPAGFVFCQDFFSSCTSVEKRLTRSPNKKQMILLANHAGIYSGLGCVTGILLA